MFARGKFKICDDFGIRLEEVPLPLCIICASSIGMNYNHRLNSGLLPTVVICLDMGGLERVSVESIGARIT